jgi:site-specific recombinase XerD
MTPCPASLNRVISRVDGDYGKHSLGMHLLERGVPKEMVQKVFGHTRPDMTDRYCQYQTKQMRVALEGAVSSFMHGSTSRKISEK